MMARRVIAGRGGFSPKALFAAGEQGVWYDPSDFSTLFQDSSGTTHVTAVEQPVGLMLDKSKGLVLGPELVDSQVASTWVAEGTNTVEQDGAEVKITYVKNPNGAYLSFTDAKALNATLVVGKTYKISFKARVNSGANVSVYVWTGAASVSGLSGLTSTSLRTHVGYFTAGSTTAAKLAIAGFSSGEQVWVSDVSIKELPGNHAYQSANTGYRPLLKQDANGKYYLLFDGSNDYLVTPSIDFTAADKMTVLAGVRKLSDATNARVIAELSATTASNNGAFALQGPDAAGAATYLWQSKGTTLTDAQATSQVAPITNILTGIGDIAGDSAILRVNGVQVDSDTGDQGTGNYGNYPLYIGARAGSFLHFNGHLYSLIVRGAQSSANLITAAERYVARKTGVTL